jgi:hypothetical protein
MKPLGNREKAGRALTPMKYRLAKLLVVSAHFFEYVVAMKEGHVGQWGHKSIIVC